MRGRPAILLPLLLLLAACDIDFMAVPSAPVRGSVEYESEHGDRVEATVTVDLPHQGEVPVVRLGGERLPGEVDDGRARFEATVTADTLDPRLELALSGPGDAVVPLPLLVRDGPARWRDDGRLELPIRYGGDPAAEGLTWELTVVDSAGRPQMNLHSSSAPLPRPLVLDRDLVPPDAETALLTVRTLDEIPGWDYPLYLTGRTDVRIPIPVDSTDASRRAH